PAPLDLSHRSRGLLVLPVLHRAAEETGPDHGSLFLRYARRCLGRPSLGMDPLPRAPHTDPRLGRVPRCTARGGQSPEERIPPHLSAAPLAGVPDGVPVGPLGGHGHEPRSERDEANLAHDRPRTGRRRMTTPCEPRYGTFLLRLLLDGAPRVEEPAGVDWDVLLD